MHNYSFFDIKLSIRLHCIITFAFLKKIVYYVQLMKLFDIQLDVCNFVYVVAVEYLFKCHQL